MKNKKFIEFILKFKTNGARMAYEWRMKQKRKKMFKFKTAHIQKDNIKIFVFQNYSNNVFILCLIVIYNSNTHQNQT